MGRWEATLIEGGHANGEVGGHANGDVGRPP